MGTPAGIFRPAFATNLGYRDTSDLVGAGTVEAANGLNNPSPTQGVLTSQNMTAILKAASVSQSVKLVQAPEIIALDNQEATVFIGKIRRYALETSNNVEGTIEREITQEELLGSTPSG